MKFLILAVLLCLSLLGILFVVGCSKDTTQSSTPPPPAAPSEMAATQTGFGTVRLTWTDNSTDETQFRVERTTDTVAGVWQDVTVVLRNATSAQDTDFSGGTQYYYRVKAQNGDGLSGSSNVAPILTWSDLPAPHLTLVQNHHFAVTLSWTDESTAEDSFRVERTSTHSDIHWQTVLLLTPNITTAEDSLIAPSTKYFYRVCAINQHGQSPYSNADSLVTLSAFPPPAGLVTTQHLRSLADISWNPAPLADSVRVEHSPDSISWATAGVLPAGTTSFGDSIHFVNQAIYYRVCSLDSLGRSFYSPKVSVWTWPAIYDFATDQTGHFAATGIIGTPVWEWDAQLSAGKITILHPSGGGGLASVVANYTLPASGWYESKFQADHWYASGGLANYAALNLKRGPAPTDKVFSAIFRPDSSIAGYYYTDSLSGYRMARVATNPQMPLLSEAMWHRIQIFHRDNVWALYTDGAQCWHTSNLSVPQSEGPVYMEWEFAQGNGPNNEVFLVDDWANDLTSP